MQRPRSLLFLLIPLSCLLCLWPATGFAQGTTPTVLVDENVQHLDVEGAKAWWWWVSPCAPTVASQADVDTRVSDINRIPTAGGLERTIFSQDVSSIACGQWAPEILSNVVFDAEFAYWMSSADDGLVKLPVEANDGDAPTWEQLALRALYYPMRTMMGRYVGIDAESLQQSRDTIERALDDVAARLDDGRPYLCGDRFSAADMTFASMLAILVLPEQYGVQLPRESDFPEAAQVDIRRARAHPAGQYALRVYAAERR